MASTPQPVERSVPSLTCFIHATQCAAHNPPTLTVATRFPRSHVVKTLHYALRHPRVAFQKHIWPFRFNGLKPLGHLSTYTGARLKRGHNNNSHTPNLKLRHSHDTKPRLRYCSQPYPALSQLLNIAAQPTMASQAAILNDAHV